MLQSSNKFKNHRRGWLFKPLRLVNFESPWIQVRFLTAVWGSRMLFSLSFSPFLNSDKVFSSIFTPLHCCWIPSLLATYPFYSVILRFLGYHWFPPLAPLGIKTNVMSATLVAGLFLIFHYFLLLRFLFQKPLVDFPILRGPRRLTFVLSFSKASRFLFFQTHLLDAFPFVIFPK